LLFIFLIGNGSFIYSQNKPQKVKIAGIVQKWYQKDKRANFENTENLIIEAASNGAEIICTPECFLDGYAIRDKKMSSNEFKDLAESVNDGIYMNKLKSLAKKLKIYIIAGISEIHDNEIYNSAVLINPAGKTGGIYRKNFLYGDEKVRYFPGEGFPVFDTSYGKFGIMICYDRQKSESIKKLSENNADFVFCPSGGGYGSDNDRIVSKRSQEGKLPIIFVHPIEFLVTSSSGEILKRNLFGNNFDADLSEAVSGKVFYYTLEL